MPVFNERWLVSTEPPLQAAFLVDVSSGDHSSEATEEGEGETSPPWQSDLLRDFSDNNDDAGAHPVRELARSAGVTTRSGGPLRRSKGEGSRRGVGWH